MLALIFTGLDIISMLFFGAGFTVSLLGVIWTLTINNHYISDTIAKRACPGVSSILKTFPSPLGTEARGAHPLCIKRLYTTTADTREPELSPYWVTGFADAESSFSLKVSQNSTTRSG
jgi:hypothetical protein